MTRPEATTRPLASHGEPLAGETEVRAAMSRMSGLPLVDLTMIDETRGLRRLFRAQLGSFPIVIKVFADDSFVTAARQLTLVSSRLAGASVATTARLFHVDADVRLLVMDDLGPTTLARMGYQGDAIAAFRRCGAALAEVHAVDSGGIRPTTIDDHVAELIAPHPRRLGIECPEWAGVVDRALASIAEVDLKWRRSGSASLIHRDFHPRQIIDIGSRIGIVDWDLSTAGDPAFDVAYLLTFLESHRSDPNGVLAHAFLSGYGQARLDDNFAIRLEAYRVFNLLRRACRRHRLRDASWQSERDRMLRAVANALGQPLATHERFSQRQTMRIPGT